MMQCSKYSIWGKGLTEPMVYVTNQLVNDSLVISSMVIWFLKVVLNFENIACCKILWCFNGNYCVNFHNNAMLNSFSAQPRY